MKEKNSFIIYHDYSDHFTALSDEQLGKLFRAIMEYEKNDTIPMLDPLLQMAFSFIKRNLDRDSDKWQTVREKKSQAGKKGMASRWDNNVITGITDNNSVKNDITKITVTDTGTVTGTVTDTVTDTVNIKESKKDSFDILIKNYTSNIELQNELKEHLKTRKAKKSSLTNRALELSFKKLDELATNDNDKIKIVQNAIMNGWTSFFELRKDLKNELNKGNNGKQSNTTRYTTGNYI